MCLRSPPARLVFLCVCVCVCVCDGHGPGLPAPLSYSQRFFWFPSCLLLISSLPCQRTWQPSPPTPAQLGSGPPPPPELTMTQFFLSSTERCLLFVSRVLLQSSLVPYPMFISEYSKLILSLFAFIRKSTTEAVMKLLFWFESRSTIQKVAPMCKKCIRSHYVWCFWALCSSSEPLAGAHTDIIILTNQRTANFED